MNEESSNANGGRKEGLRWSLVCPPVCLRLWPHELHPLTRIHGVYWHALREASNYEAGSRPLHGHHPLPPRTEASCTSLSHNGSHARRLLLAFWVAVCTCRQLMALVLLSPPPYRVKSSQKTIRKVNGIVSIVSKRTVDWSTVWSTHHLSFKPEAKVRVKPFQ